MQEYLQLDLLTLEQISAQAGRPIEPHVYLRTVEEAKARGHMFECRCNGRLLGYCTVKPLDPGYWFVLMFNTHPQHRSRRVFASLMAQLKKFLQQHQAHTLVSHVFKINHLSVAFHHKMGFKITRGNEHGYEFTLKLDDRVRYHRLEQRIDSGYSRSHND